MLERVNGLVEIDPRLDRLAWIPGADGVPVCGPSFEEGGDVPPLVVVVQRSQPEVEQSQEAVVQCPVMIDQPEEDGDDAGKDESRSRWRAPSLGSMRAWGLSFSPGTPARPGKMRSSVPPGRVTTAFRSIRRLVASRILARQVLATFAGSRIRANWSGSQRSASSPSGRLRPGNSDVTSGPEEFGRSPARSDEPAGATGVERRRGGVDRRGGAAEFGRQLGDQSVTGGPTRVVVERA